MSISLEQRERELDEARRARNEATDAWLEARAMGRVSPALQQRKRDAWNRWEAAARRVDEARKRLARQQQQNP